MSGIHAKASVSNDFHPSLDVDVDIAGQPESVQSIRARLSDLHGNVIKQHLVKMSEFGDKPLDNTNITSAISWDLKGVVKLWWPAGYGEQTLHILEIEILGDVRCIINPRGNIH